MTRRCFLRSTVHVSTVDVSLFTIGTRVLYEGAHLTIFVSLNFLETLTWPMLGL
jgi:hypothetical protein